jgi:hypothetical protein
LIDYFHLFYFSAAPYRLILTSPAFFIAAEPAAIIFSMPPDATLLAARRGAAPLILFVVAMPCRHYRRLFTPASPLIAIATIFTAAFTTSLSLTARFTPIPRR